MQNYTPIKHAEIFSSVESVLKFFSPKETEKAEVLRYVLFGMPSWHPSSFRGNGAIGGVSEKDGEIKITFLLPVNPSIPIDISLSNEWIIAEHYSGSLEKISSYFVNGTIIGDENGNLRIIENGPNEFTWTFKAPICTECQKKEENADA